MNIIEAIQTVVNGEFVARPHWSADGRPGFFLAKADEFGSIAMVRPSLPSLRDCESKTRFTPSFDDYTATDWKVLPR